MKNILNNNINIADLIPEMQKLHEKCNNFSWEILLQKFYLKRK